MSAVAQQDERVELEFIEPEDASAPTFGNVLLYGPPKTGKTAGASSGPGLTVYVNADLPNAMRFARQRDEQGRLLVLKWGGKKMLHDIMVAVWQEPRVADTVVLDTYGEAYRRLLDEASGGSARPTLNQRGDVAGDLERFARFMCEAPVNFVIVCHEYARTVETDDGTRLESIAFTGSKAGSETNSPKLMSMVDVIGYTGVLPATETEAEKYVAQLVPGNGRQAGDRFNCLAGELGYREVNLTEWFQTAGVFTGDTAPPVAVQKGESK